MTIPPENRTALLKKLPEIEVEKSASRDEEQFRAMSLARSLRSLAGLDCGNAFELARDIAGKSLGYVPELEPLTDDDQP